MVPYKCECCKLQGKRVKAEPALYTSEEKAEPTHWISGHGFASCKELLVGVGGYAWLQRHIKLQTFMAYLGIASTGPRPMRTRCNTENCKYLNIVLSAANDTANTTVLEEGSCSTFQNPLYHLIIIFLKKC